MRRSFVTVTLLFLYSSCTLARREYADAWRPLSYTPRDTPLGTPKDRGVDAWRLVGYMPRDTPVGTPRDTPLGTPKVRGVDAWRLVGYTPRDACRHAQRHASRQTTTEP